MPLFAVVKKTNKVSRVTDRDDTVYELGGDDEWFDGSELYFYSYEQVKTLILKDYKEKTNA